ncbi:hypothetical protein PPYR_12877 [Photinus pyralis]|uniref:Carboxylic ester hydrolase n=2 Tax=Photinus pyralis TaxID=7054 RepID=A0A5N4A7F1_PHOPY|nr:venom carboxylesterase-6-like isoform X1 [Photinus pyralis]XP_031338678.1 venom carboxylesterase-6-like isoform X1 [Photinus pyralis]XP_031355461.1 venom carboxylesterase-6-like isoform X1 [Photinus pyralis]XP_031355462.1 venom carboxylesterase-6-like isoform X1 [Photinus pyralis]KAB0793257.1 hypothetical protein PPYR_12877 [Photinus pyralis]
MNVCLFLLALFMCPLVFCANLYPKVKTSFGLIVGKYSTSYSGRRYAEYLSVPYAQPPLNDLRFKEPQPLKPWLGVWHANFSTKCAQLKHDAATGGIFMGQEDCLYISIFVPEVQHKKELDVIFNIHGGGFSFGGGNNYANPVYLMDRDVIFITVNYRLGVLGFMSTEDEVLPGNNGMKDQVQAIKWVKDNIRRFGGNPNSITLSGLSAGGASVQFHFLSPLSKGLFKGGISGSGNVLCPWVMQENPLRRARETGAAVGCNQKSTVELIKCMEQRSVAQLVETSRIHRAWLYNPFTTFGLVVEKFGNNPFLPEHPYALLRRNAIQDLPWLTSTVSHEGLYPVADFLTQDKYLEELKEKWTKVLPSILHYEDTIPRDRLEAVSIKIREFYFKNKPVSREMSQELIKIASDRLFFVDTDKSIRLQARANKSPTYYYYFAYTGEITHTFTDFWAPGGVRHGVCHGDDLAFIFPFPTNPYRRIAPGDEHMKETLLNIWTTFASTGVPKVDGVEWTPISSNEDDPINYLHIKSPNEIQMKSVDSIGNRAFWDSLNFEENERLFVSNRRNEL